MGAGSLILQAEESWDGSQKCAQINQSNQTEPAQAQPSHATAHPVTGNS